MAEPLRDLMERLAEEQPAVAVDPALYARGRRAHRRGTVLRAGVATALVGVAALAAVPVLDPVDGPTTPAVGDREPAMPARLHPVPERLASFHADGYRWHRELRADDLAIGTTAAVFPVGGGAVVAVSALDGGYRGLELPGFDDGSYFRFEDTPVTLSPDGSRIAWTWNPDVEWGTDGDDIETGLRIADLDTGEVTDVEIPSRLGVAVHGLSWSPGGRYLAYGVQVVTQRTETSYGTGRFRVERLDTTTGERIKTPLKHVESAPAVFDDGTVAVAGYGSYAVWSPDDPEIRGFDGPFDNVVWSPDGRRTALSSTTRHLAVGDAEGIRQEVTSNAPRQGRQRVLGWPDNTGFVVVDERSETLDLVSANLEERRTLVRADGVADLDQLSVAIDLLDRPTRDTPAPDWPTDWLSIGLRAALAVAALLAGVALVVSLRRRTT